MKNLLVIGTGESFFDKLLRIRLGWLEKYDNLINLIKGLQIG